MRKLVIVLLLCFVVAGCKKNQLTEIVVENAVDTTRPLAPQETTVRPVATESATASHGYDRYNDDRTIQQRLP